MSYPWKERVCKWFKLNGTVIREPIKWDNVNIVGKRDKEWHGFNYMYSDGVIELEFDCDAGKGIIEAEYDINGSDGLVTFQHGYTYNSVETVLFDGKLNLNTFKRHPGKVSASVEKSDFNAEFNSRFETKVSMAAATTIDGDAITPPAPVEFTFHAKEIIRKFKLRRTTPESYQNVNADRFKEYNYIHPNTNDPELSEIEDFFGSPLLVNALKPEDFDLYRWRAKFSGNYSFVINYALEVGLRAVFEVNSYVINNIFSVNGIETVVGPTYQGILTENSQISITVLYNASIPVDLNAGDRVFFYTKIRFNSPQGGGVVVDANQGPVSIDVTALERSEATPAKAWLYFDAVDHAIKSVTNNALSLRSSFLQSLLCTLTNGFQIRRFEVEKHPLNIALKDLLGSAKAMFCIGYGFENDGSEKVVVERVDYFYQSRLIATIDEVSTYREEAAKDLLYNQIEIGYSKFLTDGYNTLDEFNTKHEYQTPIKTNKLKLTALSSLITSGYTIEDVRRKQFSETATNSTSFDDDGFAIAMNAAGTAPEKNEPFEIIQNVISPDTIYNGRFSPRRMLVNWAQWIAPTLRYKATSELIKNTFAAQNGEFVTQFKATEPNPIGDINKRMWKENEEYPLSALFADVPDRMFSPEWIYFKTRITPDVANLINESLAGKRDSATNYGYIQVRSYTGEYVAGFPYETEYNYATEQFSCKMLRRFDGVVITETYYLIDDDADKIVDSDGSGILYELPVGTTYYITDENNNRLVDDDGEIVTYQ